MGFALAPFWFLGLLVPAGTRNVLLQDEPYLAWPWTLVLVAVGCGSARVPLHVRALLYFAEPDPAWSSCTSPVRPVYRG